VAIWEGKCGFFYSNGCVWGKGEEGGSFRIRTTPMA
jgi:hypothetical protein